MDLEHIIPTTIYEGKVTNQGGHMHDTKPLYLETDASGFGLGAALLKLHNMKFYDETKPLYLETDMPLELAWELHC